MRAWLLLAIFLAGCLGGGGEADDVTGDGEPQTQPTGNTTSGMTQHGCTSFYSMHSVAEAWANARLPSGFEPVPRDASGVYFASKSWQCRSTELDNETYPDRSVVLYYIGVAPPEAYADEGVVFYWLPLQMLAEAPLADYFAHIGFPATTPVQVSVLRPLGTDEIDTWSASAESRGGEHIDILVEITEKAASDSFVIRYFAGDEHGVSGWVDITVHPHSQGTGHAVFDSDAPDGPFMAAEPGTGTFQGWDEGELSYTWLAGAPELLAVEAT